MTASGTFSGMQVLTKKSALDGWIAVIIGSIVFVYVTGGSVLLPWNRSWLMFGDTAQHYLGWEFFRQTPILNWPIGANFPFGMEVSSSIVFSDSIPIAAFIAKLFNPLLPVVFQYLGFWILLCFVLQAFFAIKIFRLLQIQTSASYLGACLLAISPPLIYRTVHAGYGHIALASHWIIIASIYLYLKPGRNNRGWSTLIVISWLVQAYFAPMVALIWIACLVQRKLCGEKYIQLLISMAVITFSSILAMWSSGYFIIGDNFNPSSWNYVFHWQPLSLVDPGTTASTGWSLILPDRPELEGANEGFSYLGMGVFALMTVLILKMFIKLGTRRKLVFSGIIVVSIILLCFNWSKPQFSEIISRTFFVIAFMFILAMLVKAMSAEENRKKFIPLILAVSALAFYSMTNRVGFGQRILFDYPLYPPLREFTHTFRTHARSIWPAYYLIVIASIVFVAKDLKRNLAILVLLSSLVTQVIDSSHAVGSARKRFTEVIPWESPMKDQKWHDFSGMYSKVVMVPPDKNGLGETWVAIDDYAAQHGMYTNSGYFSRYDEIKWDKYEKSLEKDLRAGIIDTDTLYFIRELKLWVQIRNSSNSAKFYRLDGFNLIAP